MIKSYKVRIFPTKDQEQLIYKHITCACCGTVKHNLKLKDRIFTCESCGLTIDRDYNAALNLQRYKIQ